MQKTSKSILLLTLFIFIFSPAAFANLESISTIGQAEIKAKANQLIINFTIRGESQNQGQLSRDFSNTTDEIITKLADKDIITKKNIKTTVSDVKTDTKENRRIYYKQKDISITTDKTDFTTDNNLIRDLFDSIKDLDPARQRVRYNVQTDISFLDYELFLTLDNNKEINQKLIELALKNAEQQATEIAKQTASNSLTLKEISEKKSNNLINFKKRLDQDDLRDIEFENLFKTELNVKYSIQ